MSVPAEIREEDYVAVERALGYADGECPKRMAIHGLAKVVANAYRNGLDTGRGETKYEVPNSVSVSLFELRRLRAVERVVNILRERHAACGAQSGCIEREFMDRILTEELALEDKP